MIKDRALESIVPLRSGATFDFQALMSWRVRNILLVSSLYDSFTFQEDGRLTEQLFSEYVERNLRYAPNIRRASTAAEALQMLGDSSFDLIISMLKVGDIDISEFCNSVRARDQEIPLVLLANNARELAAAEMTRELTGTDRVFVWRGDVRLFLAIIKSVEDRINAWHDSSAMGVPNLILVEDNVRFYSSYLPMLYSELMSHSQDLLSDGLNRMQKMFRMRARPKILLATTFEEGKELFDRYHDAVMGVIVDASFPRNGKVDPEAGFEFAKMVKTISPDRPLLMQSSDDTNAPKIHSLGGMFINKRSPTLLNDLRHFLKEHLGFADFQFRTPDGRIVASATDIRSLQERIADVPIESVLHHAGRNDFSTWLMNRTEFDLARELRPQRIEDFRSYEDLRAHLVQVIEQYREKTRAGVVAEFSKGTFEGTSGFVRIGEGSLGGKGRGLAFMHTLLESYQINERFDDVNIFIPPTAVLTTEIFDEFMGINHLTDFALSDVDDAEITKRFMEATLPRRVLEALNTFLSRVRYPLAVRSSSLLEDGSHQPFAGVYRTYMIPNNHEDLRMRLSSLMDAIKLVYASTYYRDPKSYISATPTRMEEEKMAVVIQETVGRQYGDHLYPLVAGVARSYNFYPMEGEASEDGTASVVLGLGKTVVDGGRSVRFCPKYPRKLYQFSSPADTLRSAQSSFLALNLKGEGEKLDIAEGSDPFIVALELNQAEKDGTLHMVGSVYDADSVAVYDGISRPGPRLVSMAGILKTDAFPIAGVISYLLEIGSAAFSGPVEIEFAADYRLNPKEKHQFGFLQIRPVVIGGGGANLDVDRVKHDEAICISNQALGHGMMDGVSDVLYVPARKFKRSKTAEIAHQIGVMNGHLKAQDRPYILIGPGRWGSSDHWLGIPVKWNQISGACCIVETDMSDIKVTPSQGTHFFQNMTSLGIAYFTVNFDEVGGLLDLDWLDSQPAVEESEFVRMVRFSEPLEIAVNGRHNKGAIMKPGKRFFVPQN